MARNRKKQVTKLLREECARRQALAVAENRKLHAELGCPDWQTNKTHAKIRAGQLAEDFRPHAAVRVFFGRCPARDREGVRRHLSGSASGRGQCRERAPPERRPVSLHPRQRHFKPSGAVMKDDTKTYFACLTKGGSMALETIEFLPVEPSNYVWVAGWVACDRDGVSGRPGVDRDGLFHRARIGKASDGAS